MNSKEKEELVGEMSESLREGKLTFLVGAGISMDRRSWLPGWDGLMSSILQAIAGQEDQGEVRYVEAHKGQLLNEVILKLIDETVGRVYASKVIRDCMKTKCYSAIHRFLAWAMKEFGSGILTPNYDELIEEAAGWRNKDAGSTAIGVQSNNLVKLHGTVSHMENARFTVDSIFAPLDDSIVNQAAPLLSNRTLVVGGYRGADEFTVIPLVFEKHKPARILWIVHPNRELDSSIKERLNQENSRVFTLDVDEVLEEVYREVSATSGCRDPELDRAWKKWSHGNKKENWWKAKVETWGNELWNKQESNVRFLWARTLEHVRAYEDRNTGYKPTQKAYQSFLKISNDKMRNLYAEAHLAYAARTTGTRSLEEFQRVVGDIEAESAVEQKRKTRRQLQELLGWTLHQYGIALQNAGQHFSAKLVLEEAYKLRTLIGDPQAAYSVFQQFMNGRQAAMKMVGSVDDFAPAGWRNWLDQELKRYSKLFLEKHQPEHYGQTVHNRAFVHQFIAGEHESGGRVDEAEASFSLALDLNRKAYNVRDRLRDPRMAAQSKIRIAECKLGLAKIACRRDNLKKARTLVKESESLAMVVKKLYTQMPQERFRYEDVQKIIAEALRLRKECLKEK